MYICLQCLYLLINSSLEYYEVSFSVFFYGFCLEVYFVWYKYSYPSFFFSCSFAWNIFSNPSLSVFVGLFLWFCSLVGSIYTVHVFFFLFLRFYLFIFRERGREGEKERNINVWLPLMWPPLGTWRSNPSMCPDWESNRQPFGLQPALNPLTYARQGGFFFFIYFIYLFSERGERKEKEREKHWSVASRMCPDPGPSLQPRQVPWPGIKPTTLQFTGWRSNQLGHTGQGKGVIF